MLDLDFHELRTMLEDEADPPPFADILDRRRRRRQRRVGSGLVAGVVVLLMVAVAVTVVGRRAGPTAQPGVPTSTPIATPTSTPSPVATGPWTAGAAARVPTYPTSMTDASHQRPELRGMLFATNGGTLVAPLSECVATCDLSARPGPRWRYRLAFSDDLGRTWRSGPTIDWLAPDALLEVAVSREGVIFAVDVAHGDVGASTDQGGTWVTWQAANVPHDSIEPFSGVTVVAGSLWFLGESDVYTWSPGTPPRSAPFPTGIGPGQLFPLNASRALLYGIADGRHTVYLTTDRDQTWSPTASPCGAALISQLGAAPDGTVWLFCGSAEMMASTDGGVHWSSRGHPSVGGPQWIEPISDRTAWFWGYGGVVIHTTDGDHWSTVTPTTVVHNGPWLRFAAVDGNRATAFFGTASSSGYSAATTGYTTTDGGQTWLRFTPNGLHVL